MPPKRTPTKKVPDPAEDGELGPLFHNRGAAQRNVSRIQTILEKSDADNVELTPAQVKVYQRSVENAHAEFAKFHQEIIALSPSDKREEQEQCYVRFTDMYEEVSVVLESWMDKFAAAKAEQISPNPNQQPVFIQAPLPRALPTFDGRYENWEKFKVMFRDVVDKSSEPDRIKLYHLEKALIGDAAGLIDAKTITDGNYARAWQLLDERFSDKRRMIDRHLASLLGVKKLTTDSYSE